MRTRSITKVDDHQLYTLMRTKEYTGLFWRPVVLQTQYKRAVIRLLLHGLRDQAPRRHPSLGTVRLVNMASYHEGEHGENANLTVP